MKVLYFLLVFIVIALLINYFVIPLKRVEIIALHKIYRMGSGLDDGVQIWVIQHPKRYAPEIIRMLLDGKPGSSTEMASVEFSELVIKQQGVREALEKFGLDHESKEMKCLVQAILGGPLKETVIIPAGENGVEVSIVSLPDNECNRK